MSSLISFRRSSRVLASLAAAGLFAGCGARTESEPVTLAALAGRTLTYALVDSDTVDRQDAAGAHRFTVHFALPEEGCTQLAAGATATFNGQPMKLEPGGVTDTGGGRDACEPTRAFIDFDPVAWEKEPKEDARVLLEDGSHTITLVLRGAKTKRRFVFQGTGDTTKLRRGQTYAYVWAPDEELPGPVTATLLREEGSAPATLALEQEAGRVSFRVPDATPIANHLLRLSGSTPGSVLTCEGVARCEGGLFHAEEFEVSVTN
ncbi:hypothetical protein P2318_05140 [Myxococcaceae bacterium GXIMD 01537]